MDIGGHGRDNLSSIGPNSLKTHAVTAGEMVDVLGKSYRRLVLGVSSIRSYIPDPEVDEDMALQLSERVPYCMLSHALRCKICTLIFDEEKIIGYAGIEQSLHTRGTAMMRYVGVDKDYTRRGIASELMESCITQAIALGCHTLIFSNFTRQGEERLPNMLLRLQQKYHRIHIVVRDMLTHESIGIDLYCRRYVDR